MRTAFPLALPVCILPHFVLESSTARAYENSPRLGMTPTITSDLISQVMVAHPFLAERCSRSRTQVKKREALSLALNLSWTMLFSLLLPLLAGLWLDKRLETSPLFVLIGAALGILAATLGVARMTIRTFSEAVGQDSEQQAEAGDKEEPE